MMHPSVSQQRAKAAYGIVSAHDAAWSTEFIALTRQLPMMLRINGLLATWAHLCSEREGTEPTYSLVMQCLLLGFEERGLEHPGSAEVRRAGRLLAQSARAANSAANERLGQRVYRAWVGEGEKDIEPLDSLSLRELTTEAIEFSGWLKRATAFWEGES